MTKAEAIKELELSGAVREKKEDRQGVTRSGWWLDDVFLAPLSDPVSALGVIRG